MADQACQDYITSLSSAFVFILATAIFNSIFSVVAIVGNITVLTAIRQTPSMQKPSFILLSGLAVADLGVGLVVQPSFTVIHILITTKHFDHICSLVTFYNISSSFLSGISVATVAALSMERFLALKLNLRYEEIITMKKTKTALVLIWISVGCLTSSWLKKFSNILGRGLCIFVDLQWSYLLCLCKNILGCPTTKSANSGSVAAQPAEVRGRNKNCLCDVYFSHRIYTMQRPLYVCHDNYTDITATRSSLVGFKL